MKIDDVLKHLDVTGDGRFTLADIQAAAEKARDVAKARQTNYWNLAGWVVAALIAGIALGAKVFGAR